MSHKLTKIKTTNPKKDLSFLSVGYRKDVFMFFVDRVELSEFLMKSFALLTMKSKPTVFDEIFSYAENEIKSTHRRSDFIR